MRALLQRVHEASVEVEGRVVGQIGPGLLVYVGVALTDTDENARRLAAKVAALRIFEDDKDKLNRSVRDARGGVLAVPNFTLLADARKGRRPAFHGAAGGEAAKPLHEGFVAALREQGCTVETGMFGARMVVRSAASGPVNVIVDMPPVG